LNNYRQNIRTSDSTTFVEPSEILNIVLIFGLIYSLLKNKERLNTYFEKILIVLFLITPLIFSFIRLNDYGSEYHLFMISSYTNSIVLSGFLIISFFSRHRLLFLISSVLIIFSIGSLPSTLYFFDVTHNPFVGMIQLRFISGLVSFVTYFVVSLKLISNLVKSKFDGLGYLLLFGLPVSIIGSIRIWMFSTHPDSLSTEVLYSEFIFLLLCILIGQYLFLWVIRSMNQLDISVIKGNVHRGGKNLINIFKLTIVSILLPLLNYIMVVVFEYYTVSQFIGLIGLIVSIFILYLLVTTSLLLINSVKSNSGDSIELTLDKNFLNTEFKTMSVLILVNLVVLFLVRFFQLDIINLSVPMGVITLITSIVLLITLNRIGKRLVEF